MFTHLVGDKAADLNDLLTHGGFRRSQSIAYRPACDQCRACVSVRVIANEFRPSRGFRKILARNADIIGEQRSAVPTSEQYSVFRAYLDKRHRHALLRPVFITQFIFNTASFLLLAVFVPYAVRHLGLSATGVGTTLAMYGVGMDDETNPRNW